MRGSQSVPSLTGGQHARWASRPRSAFLRPTPSKARNGEGEEALRRVSGLLGAAAAARNAKGVEVKAILAADVAEADPAERARADLEHLEAREREIASWRPR